MLINPIKKEQHKTHCSRWRKQVLQNAPINFRPKDYEAIFLKGSLNKSAIIRKALKIYIRFVQEPQKLLDEMSLMYPLDWRYINRKNGKLINEKYKILKRC